MVSSQSKRYKGKINSKVCTWNAVVLDSTIGYRFVIVSQRWFTNKAVTAESSPSCGQPLDTSFWFKCLKLRCHDFSALAD